MHHSSASLLENPRTHSKCDRGVWFYTSCISQALLSCSAVMACLLRAAFIKSLVRWKGSSVWNTALLYGAHMLSHQRLCRTPASNGVVNETMQGNDNWLSCKSRQSPTYMGRYRVMPHGPLLLLTPKQQERWKRRTHQTGLSHTHELLWKRTSKKLNKKCNRDTIICKMIYSYFYIKLYNNKSIA